MLQTIAFPAGGRQIDAKASFFRYESCSANGADESMRVRADGNDLGLFLPGDYVDLPMAATRWELTTVTGTATGTVRLGMGEVGSSRLTGNVRVIDQSADKTAAGRQFYSSALYPADAANVSFVGVLPNGAQVAVRALVLQSATAGAVRLGRGTAGGTTTATNAAMENKLIGAAASAARKFYGIAATANPAAGEIAGYSQIASFYLSANQPFTVEFKEPLILSGTNVLAINGGVINRDISSVFAIEEI